MGADSLSRSPLYRQAARIQGARLRVARLEQNWSQPEAAESVGVSVDVYRKWEHGKRCCPAGVRERFAELWGVDRAALGLDPGRACPCCGRRYRLGLRGEIDA
jgi:DNA-binding XRE family transcriptional regulator